MSAKDMFKKLGYKQTNNDNYSICYSNEEENFYIYFYKYWKKIEVLHDITIQELKAINKQVEELGWNNEKV